MKKLPIHCPSCNSTLRVTRLGCPECETEVNGNFDLPVFFQLSESEQKFVLDFVKTSGSLKDMAKNIGVSYPTVRNMLDELIQKIKHLEE